MFDIRSYHVIKISSLEPGYLSKRSNLIQIIDSTWKNNPHTNFYHGIYQQIVILRFHNNDNLLRNGPLAKSNNQDLWDLSHCSTIFINVLTIYDYLNRLFFPFISAWRNPIFKTDGILQTVLQDLLMYQLYIIM